MVVREVSDRRLLGGPGKHGAIAVIQSCHEQGNRARRAREMHGEGQLSSIGGRN